MDIIRIEKSKELVRTEKYPYAKFPFETFNPVQSSVFSVFDKNSNWCFATSTSSGKTVMGEMCLAHEIRANGGKGLYVAPYKALAQEKIDDWKNNEKHHFSDLNVSICTGDYSMTPDRVAELDSADLILMTCEMLNSRSRNINSEKSNVLKNIGVVVFDEAHLLTEPGRGDHLEVAIMKLTKINPNVRICFLSATMPNVEEVARWLSRLTNRQTYLLVSDWRPCHLNVHYETYPANWYYDLDEEEKINAAYDIVRKHPHDKFLIFTHSKRTGEAMKKLLLERGIGTDFHNADLSKERRLDLESRFRGDPKFRVIVATSTLSTGINTPARRVIVLGTKRGFQDIPVYSIHQMVGRSGRPGYDPEGDGYILIQDKNPAGQIDRLQTPEPIRSQLMGFYPDNRRKDYKVLTFHVVSEIHHRDITTRKDFREWFSRSLAHHQANDLDTEIMENVIDLLIRCGAIKEEDGELKASAIGMIASMFYFSPFDVSDLRRNFGKLFEKNNQNDDLMVALALANIDSNRNNIVTKAEREELSSFINRLDRLHITNIPDPVAKAAFCYLNLISGKTSMIFNSMMRGLQYDFPRTLQVIKAIDQMSAKWGKQDWLSDLSIRVSYGVSPDRSHLCRLPHIGATRANRLWDAGLRNFSDVASNPAKIKSLTRLKQETVDEIVYAAKIFRDR